MIRHWHITFYGEPFNSCLFYTFSTHGASVHQLLCLSAIWCWAGSVQWYFYTFLLKQLPADNSADESGESEPKKWSCWLEKTLKYSSKTLTVLCGVCHRCTHKQPCDFDYCHFKVRDRQLKLLVTIRERLYRWFMKTQALTAGQWQETNSDTLRFCRTTFREQFTPLTLDVGILGWKECLKKKRVYRVCAQGCACVCVCV